jgi:LuxR family maltose regulon positive regulatory protein
MVASSQTPALIGSKTALPPAREDTIPRPRLLKRLDEEKHASLTLLSAPAGSGKTTFLCDWLPRQPGNLAWVSLTPDDDDPMRFWTYVITAVRTFAGDFGREVMPLLTGHQEASPESLATTFANALSGLEGETTLALDNLQVINHPSIHATLASIVEHLPPNVRIVIASRTDPTLPLSRLRSRGQMVEVRSEELQFTLEESRDFLNKVMRMGLSHRDVDALHARTEGWTTGLRLAAIALAASSNPSEIASHFGGNHPHVFDYFADEVLASLPHIYVDRSTAMREPGGSHHGSGPWTSDAAAVAACQHVLDCSRRAISLVPLSPLLCSSPCAASRR